MKLTGLTRQAYFGDLDIWLIGSPELMLATSSLCQVSEIDPEEWQVQLADHRPSFVLVEGRERLPELWMGQLGEFLATCEQQNIPRFLWITASPFDPALRQHCHRFSRVFTVDWDQHIELTMAKAQHPSLLWPGTTISCTSRQLPTTYERPDSVVWLGGWRSDWPEAWRIRLLSVLEAATERDLRVVCSTEAEHIPASLRAHIDATSPLDLHAQLLRARIVIGADAKSASPGIAPRVAFDAMACGAAVVTPHTFAMPYSFSQGNWRNGSWRSMVPVVANHGTAGAAIDRFLADNDLLATTTERCRDIVMFNHTHAHRLATLASAAAIRVVHNA